MTKEVEGAYLPTSQDFAEHRQTINQGLIFTRQRESVNLLWWPTKNQDCAWIWLIIDHWDHARFLCEAIPRSKITLEEILMPNVPKGINDRKRPWEMLLDAPKATLEETIRHIYPFLRDYYPQVADLPINFFENARNFRNRQPLARVELGKLVVRTL